MNRQSEFIQTLVVDDHVAVARRRSFLEHKPKILGRVVSVTVQKAPLLRFLQALVQRAAMPNKRSAGLLEIFLDEVSELLRSHVNGSGEKRA